MTALTLLVGLILLILGGDLLVRGASRLAAAFGIPALIIGLTVVAFGTSSPELAVSVQAAMSDQADIAVGNVVGSNIFNVLFILGLSALIVPLAVSSQLIRFDVPLMIGVSCAALVMALDGAIGRLDGMILLAGLIVWILLLARLGRKEAAATRAAGGGQASTVPVGENGRSRHVVNVVLILVGLVLLVLGSRWFVDGAVTFARWLGVTELVIGLTVIAAGTSLPEVVTSILASLRGERDIAVGNVVGSNLFNILGVLGLSSVVAPDGLVVAASALWFDFPIMIAVAVACLPIFFTGARIERWEGGLFFAFYCAWTGWLVLAATGHAALSPFNAAMALFVLPLTAITLLMLAVRARRGSPS
jgi:cation:H+ antiporter